LRFESRPTRTSTEIYQLKKEEKMFSTRINKGKNNLPLWISISIFLLILFITWGCGDSDEMISSPTTSTVDTASDWSIMAAPPSGESYFYTERVITEYGGQLVGGDAAQGTKLYIRKGALSEKTVISMEAWSDGVSRVNFRFGPHGTEFAVPAELELGWAVLKNVSAEDLILYYYDEQLGEWVEETQAIWDKNKATLYLNHFSEYYFQRR
jgi:hypothetical protein